MEFIRCRRFALSLMAAGFVSFIAQAESPAAEYQPLRAGAASADITPQKWPVELIGSFSQRLAGHAWNRLNARALVLDNGETRLAFVTVDSCLVPRSLFDEAKRRAAALCDIPTDHILAAATHTHSAPPAKNRPARNQDADAQYVEHMTRGIVSAIHQATDNLAPAELGWGTCLIPEEVHNRRWFMKEGGIVPSPFGETTDVVRMNPPRGRGLLDRPAGPVDPEVVFLSVRTHEGRPIALLANYSLHYVGGVPAGGVSSDCFGEFATQLQAKLFPDGQRDSLPPFVGILSNGTSGDINNINFTNPQPRAKPFVRIQEVAGLVVDRILEAMPAVKYERSIPLAMAQQDLTLKVRKLTAEQVARAKQFVAEPDEKNLPPRAKPYAAWTLELAAHPGTEDILLQAVRVGDVGITSIPCKAFPTGVIHESINQPPHVSHDRRVSYRHLNRRAGVSQRD